MAVELNKLLRLVVDKRASELTFSSNVVPVIRLKGNMRPLNLPPLTTADILRYLSELAPHACMDEFNAAGQCEFGLPFGRRERFYVTASRQGAECRMRVQLVPKKPPYPEEGSSPGS